VGTLASTTVGSWKLSAGKCTRPSDCDGRSQRNRRSRKQRANAFYLKGQFVVNFSDANPPCSDRVKTHRFGLPFRRGTDAHHRRVPNRLHSAATGSRSAATNRDTRDHRSPETGNGQLNVFAARSCSSSCGVTHAHAASPYCFQRHYTRLRSRSEEICAGKV